MRVIASRSAVRSTARPPRSFVDEGGHMRRLRGALYLTALASIVLVAGACSMSTSDSGAGRTASAAVGDPSGGDWTTYHGTYRSWHYSPLTEINTDNVKK